MNELQTQNNQSGVPWIPAEQLTMRINRMVEVQKKVMKNDVHYGVIPGCQKPSLYKPGAQLLCMTFQVGSKPHNVEDLSTTGEKNYRVTLEIFDQKTGTTLGYGIGECSSMEDKYAWRKAVCDEEYQATPDHLRREKYFKGKNGQGHYVVQQIRTNPHDVANTVLKMAEKRALIDGTLNVLAASEVFTQDIEDLPDGMAYDDDRAPQSTKPNVKPEDITAEFPEKPTKQQSMAMKLINEAQAKRFYAICNKSKVLPEAVFAFAKVKNAYWFTWDEKKQVNYNYIVKAVEEKPEFFEKYKPVEKKPDPAPEVQGSDEFESLIASMVKDLGWTLQKFDDAIMAEYSIMGGIKNIPADMQNQIVDWLTSLQEQAGA